MNRLRDSVIRFFDLEHQMNDTILKTVFVDKILKDHGFPITFNSEVSEKALFGKSYFNNAGTSNDVFIFSMGNYWYSPLYFHNNEPFLFSTSFAFKFKLISDQKTILTIADVDPKISNGTKCCGHSGNIAIEQKVPPTTIEEYTLILFIAEKLGVKGLATIQLPNK